MFLQLCMLSYNMGLYNYLNSVEDCMVILIIIIIITITITIIIIMITTIKLILFLT